MITKKPSIFIYVQNPHTSTLKEICAGIEEEGVFYEILEVAALSVDELAWKAANDSMTGSGIGVVGSQAVLQLRGMSKGHNVAVIQKQDLKQSRQLGTNSARAVKRLAFK